MSQASISGIATIILKNANGDTTQYPSIIFSSGDLYLQSEDLDLGSPNKQKYVDAVHLDLEAPREVPQLYINVGIRDRLQDEVIWLGRQQVDLDNPIVEIRETAMFFTIRFEDDLPTTQWKLSRMEWYGQLMEGRGR